MTLANFGGTENGPDEYVTVPEKRAHFRQYFQIELLVLNGRVALKQQYGVYFLS